MLWVNLPPSSQLIEWPFQQSNASQHLRAQDSHRSAFSLTRTPPRLYSILVTRTWPEEARRTGSRNREIRRLRRLRPPCLRRSSEHNSRGRIGISRGAAQHRSCRRLRFCSGWIGEWKSSTLGRRRFRTTLEACRGRWGLGTTSGRCFGSLASAPTRPTTPGYRSSSANWFFRGLLTPSPLLPWPYGLVQTTRGKEREEAEENPQLSNCVSLCKTVCVCVL